VGVKAPCWNAKEKRVSTSGLKSGLLRRPGVPFFRIAKEGEKTCWF
jgi:hypothetical protein